MAMIDLHRIDDPHALLSAILRADFGAFLRKAAPYVMGASSLQWNWHLDAIAHRLERIQNGHDRFLIVNVPPRALKSIAISVAWVAWMLGQDPSRNFVCVSYSSELAAKLARMCREIMMSPWYRELFPRTVISRQRSAIHDFETTAGGGRLATSPAGTLTGRGGDIIIVDDPIKPDEALSETTRDSVNDWFSSTLVSRLDDKNAGSIIIVMQRLHEYDLCGMLLDRGGWTHLNIPAIATSDEIIRLTKGRSYVREVGQVLHPEREGQAALDQMKAAMGSILFSAQYQQEPTPVTGTMAKAAHLCFFDRKYLAMDGRIVQSWDTASKDGVHNDWSVCITALVRGQDVYVLDVFRQRLDFYGLEQAAIKLAREYRPEALLVEDAASGTQLIQTLKRGEPSGVPRPIGRKAETDKITRFGVASAMIEAGQLHLPHDALWLGEFKSEILSFPNGKFDDQADALAQLLIWVRDRPIVSVSSHGAFVPEARPHWEEDLDDGFDDHEGEEDLEGGV
jgi:predicted phage terminase large subunit-like protein